jgi:predicted transcriptional regulator
MMNIVLEKPLLSRKEKFVFVNTSFDLNIPEQKALYEQLNELAEQRNEKRTAVIRKLLTTFLAAERVAQ